MMKKARRAAQWFLLNGSMAVVVWFALQESAEWARNLALFVFWFFAVVAVFGVFAVAHTRVQVDHGDKEIPSDLPERPVPQWLSVAYDFAMIGVLAAFGWFATAIAWAVQMVAERITYSFLDDMRKLRDKESVKAEPAEAVR